MGYLNCVAFLGDRQIAGGALRDVARQVKREVNASVEPIQIFDAETSAPIEIDLRGSEDEVLARLPEPSEEDPLDETAAPSRRGPGRPKLGVVAREVTLLPRHWDWLTQQPGGASVTIRRLIDAARRASGTKDRVRRAQEAAYRFASAIAGNRPNYEDAMRALFAHDRIRFEQMTQAWPTDIRAHIGRLAAPAFENHVTVASGTST